MPVLSMFQYISTKLKGMHCFNKLRCLFFLHIKIDFKNKQLFNFYESF